MERPGSLSRFSLERGGCGKLRLRALEASAGKEDPCTALPTPVAPSTLTALS